MTKSEVIFVHIRYSTRMKGNILEWDAIEGEFLIECLLSYRVSEGTLSHRCKYPRESKALRGQQFRLLNVLLLFSDVPEMTHALSGIYDE
ncbi:11431_t:CDS:2 [Cetraspora pellucida]|nr:11431_t:CDS:2 [Cetraspora pellucida]